MSEFGRRPSFRERPAPVAATSADSTSNGPLPFSYLGLIGAAALSAVITLAQYPILWKAMEALPEMAEVSPQDVRRIASLMWWTGLASGFVEGVVNCIIAHRIARFFGRSDLWLFALGGLVLVPLFLFAGGSEPGEARKPMLMTAILIAKGPLTTSAYWLLAKWRAAA